MTMCVTRCMILHSAFWRPKGGQFWVACVGLSVWRPVWKLKGCLRRKVEDLKLSCLLGTCIEEMLDLFAKDVVKF